MRLAPGDLIDNRFAVERIAGTGGMATVYRALDRRTGVYVALKVIEDEDPETAQRFDREALSLSGLEHPAIVGWVAHGDLGQHGRYLAMEWLEGESLAQRVGRRRLSIEETAALGARIARALEALHARGIIHRDLKPSNLILTAGMIDKVKLIDFGIAQMASGARRLTQTGMALGTPGYMAPEQARGDGSRVDGRADLFSLGAVLFECLAGRPAFEGKHLVALLARLLFEEAPRVRDHRADAPRALDELVFRLLAKEPEDRPADAGEVARALEAIEGPARLSMRPPPSGELTDLGLTERKLFSIVSALPTERADKREGGEERPRISRELLSRIEAAVSPFGADVDALANGALFVTLSGKGSAPDLATRAARAALALRPLLPATSIALVTGLGETSGKLPIGVLAERAVVLLERAAQRNRMDEVLVDEVTAALVDGRFDVMYEPDAAVLKGSLEAPEKPRTLLGKPSPFVGRERELRIVEEFVTASFDELSPRAVLVTGAAGMGKSRLRAELIDRLRVARPEVVIDLGRGDVIAQGSTFSVIASALQRTARITAGEPGPVRRQKLVETFGRHLPAASREHVLEFLGEMLGAPADDPTPTPNAHAVRQSASLLADRIREAYLELMAAELGAGPRLVVLEDLQWGDAASIKLMDAALGALAGKPFAVLALARPEVHDLFPKLWAKRDMQEIRLGALPKRVATELVRHYMDEATSAEEVDRIVARAAGNVFYLEELVRAVAEGRGNEVPETALGLVESRLAALAPKERRLLRVASVFGQVFWEDGLAALVSEPPEDVASTLASFEPRELAFRRESNRFAGRVEWVFRHALLQEASYATLTERDRCLAHMRAGEWLLSAGETDPKVLAEHFGRAGDAERAIGYYVFAAEQSLAAGDHEAAVALADSALALGATGERAAALRAIQTDAWTWSSQYVRAHEAAQVALFLAPPGSLSHARALGGVISNGHMLGRLDVIEDALAQLLVVEPYREAIPAIAWAFGMAVGTLIMTSRVAEAEMFLKRMAEVTRISLDDEPSVAGWLAHARAYWARFVDADLYAAMVFDRESIRAFRESGDQRYWPNAEIHLGSDLLNLGAFEQAEAAITRGISASPPFSQPTLLGRCVLAWIHLDRGNCVESIQIAEAIAKDAEDIDATIVAMNARFTVVEARVHRGDLERASRDLEALADVARGSELGRIWHLHVSAEAAFGDGHPEEAASLCAQAIACLSELAITHRRASALFALQAESLLASDQHEEAKRALVRAKEYIERHAARILEPALKKSYLERAPGNARILALYEEWVSK